MTAAATATAAGSLSCRADGSRASAPAAGAGASPGAVDDETGFVDVPPQESGSPFPARMFYVFEAADGDAASRPLAVFMAGGPGYPSSLELLPFGTARATLASPTAPSVPPAPNSASWTSFANLLFVDERQSGFSYELRDESAPATSDAAAGCAFSPMGDAADFVRVVLAFLDSHPTLQAAPVVLVGQSYGGERATLMLDLLLRYSTEAPPVDPALEAMIQAHWDAVFPGLAGTVVDPAVAVTQFGWVVLLQPFVLGGLQYAEQSELVPSDPYVGAVDAGQDPYDVRQPDGWSRNIDDTPTAVLTSFANAASLLAADPRSIPLMAPPARPGAFRVVGTTDPVQEQMNAAWSAELGALDAADRYLVVPATACPVGESLYTGPGSQDAFVANLRSGVQTFITDARYDAVIYAPAIPAALEQFGAVTVDTTARAGVARPGWFTVSFDPDGGAAALESDQDGGPAPAIEIRFPPYDDSGHFVAVAQPQALHDDVAAWLLATP